MSEQAITADQPAQKSCEGCEQPNCRKCEHEKEGSCLLPMELDCKDYSHYQKRGK